MLSTTEKAREADAPCAQTMAVSQPRKRRRMRWSYVCIAGSFEFGDHDDVAAGETLGRVLLIRPMSVCSGTCGGGYSWDEGADKDTYASYVSPI